jgi:hypothetical protein
MLDLGLSVGNRSIDARHCGVRSDYVVFVRVVT